MDTSNKNRIEWAADVTLFILVTLPFLAIIITMPFCSGWNVGSMGGACSPSMLGGLYNGINWLLTTLFGLLFVGSTLVESIILLILIATVVSLVIKVRKFVQGYRPSTVLVIIAELVFVLPFVALLYLLYLEYGYMLFGQSY